MAEPRPPHDPAHDHPGLEVRVERTEAGTARVSFTVSPEEFEAVRRRGLLRLGSRTRMKGFRPGKIPISMLEQKFGEEVRQEAVRHFLNHALDTAIEEHDLRPAAHPRIDLDSIEAPPGEAFEHAFELYLRPQIELEDYKGLEIEGRPIVVEDGEIEAAIEDLRRQRSHPEPAGEDGLPADGMAVSRLEFSVEGAEEPVLTRDGIRVSPRTPPPGVEAEAFEKALLGAVPGTVVEVPIDFPEEFGAEEARGKRGTCRIRVDEAFRIVPPAEEELFGLFEVEDPEGLRGAVRERIREGKGSEEDGRIETELLAQVVARHPMELPSGYVEEQVAGRAEDARRELVAQGAAEEEAAARIEAELPALRESTERALRALYIMEEIARAQGIQVGAADVQGELAGIARRNGVPVDDVRKYYQERGLLSQLSLELLERKVRSFLREAADIKVTS